MPEAQSRTLLEILNSEANYILGYKNTDESSTGQPVKNFADYSQSNNNGERIGDPFLDYDEDLEINLSSYGLAERNNIRIATNYDSNGQNGHTFSGNYLFLCLQH